MKNKKFFRTVAVYTVTVLLTLTCLLGASLTVSAAEKCPHDISTDLWCCECKGHDITLTGNCNYCYYILECEHFTPINVYCCYCSGHKFVNGECTVCRYDEPVCDHGVALSTWCCECKGHDMTPAGNCKYCYYILECEHFTPIDVYCCYCSGHKFVNGVCTECRYKECNHQFEDGICIQCQYRCLHPDSETEKKYTAVDNLEHKALTICKNCEKQISEKIELHNFKDSMCDRCQYVYEELDISGVDYGSYGEIIYSKPVLLEKTDKGFLFVRSTAFIGGKNMITLAGSEYMVGGSVSLKDYGDTSVTVYDKDGGVYPGNGRYVFFDIDLSHLEHGKTYTFSCYVDTRAPSANVFLFYYDSAGKNIGLNFDVEDNRRIYTFTYNKNFTNYRLCFHTNTSNKVSYGAPFTARFYWLQLEQGAEATTYEPFNVFRFNDYDLIYKEGYQAALDKFGGEANGSILRGFIASAYDVITDSFDKLNKGTTINGISLSSLIYTSVALLIAYFVIKFVKK